jgi:hypothetical protein
MIMEAEPTTETSVYFIQTTRHYIPEVCHLSLSFPASLTLSADMLTPWINPDLSVWECLDRHSLSRAGPRRVCGRQTAITSVVLQFLPELGALLSPDSSEQSINFCWSPTLQLGTARSRQRSAKSRHMAPELLPNWFSRTSYNTRCITDYS